MPETRSDWSKLCPDLLRSILEGLISKDFRRARTVCSNWYSVSTTCVRPVYPWRILFDEHSTLLFDPGEDNIHEIGHPELELFTSHVMASCSNWLLIRDARLNLYLQNVFTRERINLPWINSSLSSDEDAASCLWINERTRNYVVAQSCKQGHLFSYKKGDDSWWCHQGIGCVCMSYKDEKLYVYTVDSCIKILDLSGDSPREVIQGNPYRNRPFHIDSHPMRVVIMSSGEVLIVVRLEGLNDKIIDMMWKHSFYSYKMNLESGNWERVVSLGGEMLIFGHGVVTIKAPIKDINGWGIKSDSICFGHDDLFPGSDHFIESNCGVFDLATSTLTSLDVPLSNNFWFVPGYA